MMNAPYLPLDGVWDMFYFKKKEENPVSLPGTVHAAIQQGLCNEEGGSVPSDEDKIRETAYYLWLKAGEPEGRDEEFWYESQQLHAAAWEKDEPVFV